MDSTITFDRIIFKLAGYQDSHKPRQIRIPARLDYSHQSYLPLSEEKHCIWPFPEHSLLSFNLIFMKLADNMDRHKISDEFKFRPDWTIDCSYLPFSAEKPCIPPCPEHSPFSFDGIFMKLADNLDRHKVARQVWIPVTSDYSLWCYLPLCAKKNIFDFVRSVAFVIFIKSLWNLQINRTGHSRYFDFAYLDTTTYVEVIFHSQHFFSNFFAFQLRLWRKRLTWSNGHIKVFFFSCPRRICYYICYCLCRSKNRRSHGRHIVCFRYVHVLVLEISNSEGI